MKLPIKSLLMSFTWGFRPRSKRTSPLLPKTLKHSSTLARTRFGMRRKPQDQAKKKMRKVMKSQTPQVNMKTSQRKICMHLEQVTNHVSTQHKIGFKTKIKGNKL